MNDKRFRWIKIANNIGALAFAENKIAEIKVDGKDICIAQTVSGLKACSSKCPHAGGDMSKGKLDKNGHIVCLDHGYVFNLNNGRDVAGEGYLLKTYPVTEAPEGVFVGIEEVNLQG